MTLCGPRAHAPASVVSPLLVTDLPAFLRWRGDLPFGSTELEQLVGVADRLIVDSVRVGGSRAAPSPRLPEAVRLDRRVRHRLGPARPLDARAGRALARDR